MMAFPKPGMSQEIIRNVDVIKLSAEQRPCRSTGRDIFINQPLPRHDPLKPMMKGYEIMLLQREPEIRIGEITHPRGFHHALEFPNESRAMRKRRMFEHL